MPAQIIVTGRELILNDQFKMSPGTDIFVAII